MNTNHSKREKTVNRPLIVIGVVISIAVIVFTTLMITNTDTLARYVGNLYTDVKETGMGLIAVRSGVQDAYFAITSAMGDPKVTDGGEMEPTLNKIWDETILSAKSAEGNAATIDVDLNSFLSQWDGLKTECFKLLKLVEKRDLDAADDMFIQNIEPVFSRMDRQLSRIVNNETDRISQYVVEATNLNNHTNQIAMAMGIGLVVLVLLVSILGTSSIARKNREIFHQEQLFRMITENIDDVFVVYDKIDRKYEFVSRNIERLFGTKAENFVNGANLDALYNGMAPGTLDEFKRMYYDGLLDEITDKEYEMKDPVTGEKCTIKTLVYPILGDSGRVEKILCIARNITKAKRAQQALEQALKAEESANNAKRLFISRMSHEIKTPINVIKGMRSIAEKSIGDDAKVLDCLNKIDNSSKHLLGLVEDILDISSLENEKLKIVKKWFKIDELLDSAYMLMSFAAAEKGIKLRLKNEEIINNVVYGDPLRIRQILVNFLSNAVKFTPTGGSVTMEVIQNPAVDKRCVTRFSVADTGPGIRKEFMDKLFVPFEQDDADPAAMASGSGLGMSISKNLAVLMGGEITVETEEGCGSKFTVEFNFKIPKKKDLEEIKIDNQPFAPPDLTGKRVLIVEDNAINMEIDLSLFKRTGCHIEQASNGREALNMYLMSPPGWYDIIMMDIQMPVMKGDEAARLIRYEGRSDSSSVIIIAMTANAAGNGLIDNKDDPMDAQVPKPVEPKDMFDTITKVLNKKKQKEQISVPLKTPSGDMGQDSHNQGNFDRYEEILQTAGIDTRDLLNRVCGNKSLALRSLKKFLKDKNFTSLITKIKGGDIDGARVDMHTFEGLIGNLGMKQLEGACIKTHAKLRSGVLPSDDDIRELNVMYQKIVSAIEMTGDSTA